MHQKHITQEEKHAHSGLQREIQTLADSYLLIFPKKEFINLILLCFRGDRNECINMYKYSCNLSLACSQCGRHHAEPASGAENLLVEKDNTIRQLELQLAETKQKLCETRPANLIDVPASSGQADQATATIRRLEQQLKESDAKIADLTSKLHSHTAQQHGEGFVCLVISFD